MSVDLEIQRRQAAKGFRFEKASAPEQSSQGPVLLFAGRSIRDPTHLQG